VDVADLDPDPIRQFDHWLHDVIASGLTEPMAMVLATCDADGQPVGRHVLLKGHGPDGFVFFTNYESRKARHLATNPRASLTFPWHPAHRQVIVLGDVERATPEESDTYFTTRDRATQLGAWASQQSEPIPSRAWLEDRVAEFDERFAGGDVPRPPHWGGFRLRPWWIELWHSRPNRLHDRFGYERGSDGGWTLTRLAP
jgi:pyridoxamine 5'-phosphate oxidase